MALAYTAPTWTDGTGQGITAAQLQALSNCVEGLVQGSDKAIHDIAINGSVITLTFSDGSVETRTTSEVKSIARIDKTGTEELVDTYTITYTDGTTSTFTVTNGAEGPQGEQGEQGIQGEQGPAGADGADGVSVTGVELLSTSGKVKTYRMTFSNGGHFDFNVTDGADGTGDGDMKAADYDAGGHVYDAGGIDYYVQEKLDEWTDEEILQSGNTVTFVGLDDNLAYDLYCDAIGTSVTNITKSGTSLTYTLAGDNLLVGITKCKLRILK